MERVAAEETSGGRDATLGAAARHESGRAETENGDDKHAAARQRPAVEPRVEECGDARRNSM